MRRFERVYNNLVAFVEANGGGAAAPLTPQQLEEKYENHKTGYVRIDGAVVAVLITGNLPAPLLVAGLGWVKDIEKDVVIVTNNVEAEKSKITQLASAGANIRLLSYSDFELNPLTHEMAYPHIVLSPEERAELIALLRVDLATLPQMKYADKQMIWRNVRRGQVVKTICPALHGGEEVKYHLVV
jgi:DNA-directed RNA polymerase subunit H (RpoH/RPB5)